jgi:hypothetical protein
MVPDIPKVKDELLSSKHQNHANLYPCDQSASQGHQESIITRFHRSSLRRSIQNVPYVPAAFLLFSPSF